MDQAVLVNFDIENGKEVIDALDRDGKTPNVALWAKIPDYEDWRLVIASDRLDQSSSRSGYTEINEAIKKNEQRHDGIAGVQQDLNHAQFFPISGRCGWLVRRQERLCRRKDLPMASSPLLHNRPAFSRHNKMPSA